MLNHEGSHHEHFEELCAIAASGQISEAEFVELQGHLQQCHDCRSAYADFVDLLHDKLPLAHPDIIGSSKLPGFFSESSSYRERFLARARLEGVAVSLEPPRGTVQRTLSSWFSLKFGDLKLAPIAAAVLLLTVGILSFVLYESNLRYTRLASEHVELTRQLSQSGQSSSPTIQESIPITKSDPVPDRKDQNNEEELARMRAENASIETRAKSLDDQLNQVMSELEALRGRSERTSVLREELEKKLNDAERVAVAAKEDLQEIRQARSKDAVTIATQDLEIRRMSEKVAEQTELLAQETALLEASRDVRDLMGSRNFHIADVFDVDSKGKDQQAFGRVFYTEGKQTLIFYAFDLSDRNSAKRNASFQVWGKRGAAQASAHSLGLFQVDDQKQNRWVLRFEDPRVLSEIDSVFVTVEPPGGSAKPTGRQFLYAYLNTNSK
jgi:anti-sigma-K factor RskA